MRHSARNQAEGAGPAADRPASSAELSERRHPTVNRWPGLGLNAIPHFHNPTPIRHLPFFRNA